MKRLYCLIVLSLLCGRLAAQRLHSFHFHDASLAAVLDTLAAVQDEYSITFIHNDLEHLHVSARIKNLTIKEAVEKVCKGQPVKVGTRKQQVFVQYKPHKNFPNKTIQITGLVLDSFTLKPVGQIDVTILDATHTVISRTRTAAGPIPVSFGYFKVREKYLLEIQSPAYQSVKREIYPDPQKRDTQVTLPDILMQLKPDTAATTMREVTVTASKLRFVWKRDTLIYDATAFNMHEGAMLRDLIHQLPGTEMDKYGQITVFGRKVDCLTLNGRDFFKGDNRVMLDNLPYYIIKDIKVYERGPAAYEQWKAMQGDKKEYVMDVVLKRDCRRGYLANAEAGGGSGGHWLARAFGSMYSDRTRIGAIVNANDLNDTRDPGRSTGDWQTIGQPKGIMTTVRAKSDMNFYGKSDKWHDMGQVVLQWSKPQTAFRNDEVTHIQDNQKRALAGGDGTSKDLMLSFDNTYSSSKPNLDLKTAILVRRGREHTSDSTTSFNNDKLVNQIKNAYYNTQLTQDCQQSLFTGWKMGNGNFLSLRASGRHAERRNDRYHLYEMSLAATGGEKSYRLQQSRMKEDELKALIGYNMPFPAAKLSLYLSAGWNYHHADKDSPLWRLERDSLFFNTFAALGQHPALQATLIDAGNSQWIKGHTHQITYSAKLSYLDKGSNYETAFALNLPLATLWQNEHIQRGQVNVDTTRNATDFLPSFTAEIRRKHSNYVWLFNYEPHVSRPLLLELTNYEDTTNPLNVLRGNPQLKNAVTHKLGTSYYIRHGRQWYRFNSQYTITHNQIVPSRIYNPNTGGYLSSSANVNGNWLWDNLIETTHALDGSPRWILTNKLGLVWQHLAYMGSSNSAEALRRIQTNRNSIAYEMKLKYRKDEKFDIEPHFNLLINHATNSQGFGTAANARDLIYGLNINWTMPYNWMLATDLNLFQRRGYGMGMNTDDVIWNTQLTKSWLKGRLQTRLTAYDILNQMHHNSYIITAEGYQSRWEKGMSRYALLSLFYRIDIKPKKARH